jgi:hypothetical protein
MKKRIEKSVQENFEVEEEGNLKRWNISYFLFYTILKHTKHMQHYDEYLILKNLKHMSGLVNFYHHY